MSGAPVWTPIVYTNLVGEDLIQMQFALAYWLVVDKGNNNAAPTWPLKKTWPHTKLSVLDLLDTHVAFVLVMNRFPFIHSRVDVHSMSVIGNAATDAIRNAWKNFAPNLPTASVDRVASILGWPD